MHHLAAFIGAVDAASGWLGRVVAWLTLGSVVTCFTVVVLRYGFSVGRPWMQELYVWQHAVVFMMGAGYTLMHQGHVSVDIIYGRLSPRRRAWLDIIGTLVFLFPWLAVVAYTSAPFILSSWAIREPSAQIDGMPAVYLLKSVLWAFCFVLFVQGLALIARRVLFLRGYEMGATNGAPSALGGR